MMALGHPASWPWSVIRSRCLWFGCCSLYGVERAVLPELAQVAAQHGLRLRVAAEAVEITL